MPLYPSSLFGCYTFHREFGCLTGSAWMPLRQERRGRICTPARQTVMSIQWGVAPSSASTGVIGRHGTADAEIQEAHGC